MADPLKVECPHCGGSLKLKDRSSEGKKVRCPKCEEVFKVVLPDDDIDEVDDLADLDNFDDNYDDMDAEERDDQDEDRPRKSGGKGTSSSSKKKKKSKSGKGAMLPLLIGGIVLGGATVVGLVVLVVMNLGGAGNRINTAYLFPEHDIIIRFKVADVVNAPLLASLVNSPMVKTATGNGIPGDLQLIDIDSVTLGMSSTATNNRRGMGGLPEGGVAVVRTKKPIDIANDAAKMNFKEATHNGKKYFSSPIASLPAQYGADAYTVIFASENDLKKVIDQGSVQKRRPELDFIDPDHQIIVVAVPQSPDGFKLPGTATGTTPATTAPGAAAMQQFQKSFGETALGVSFGIDLREGIDVSGKLNCKDDGGAGALKGQLDLMLGEARTHFETFTKAAPAATPDLQQVVQLMQQSMSSIAVGQNSKTLDLKLAVPSTLKSIVDKAVSDPLFGMRMAGVVSSIGGGGMMGGTPAATGSFPPGQLPPGQLPADFPMPDASGNFPPGSLPPGAFPAGTDPASIPMPMPANP